VGVALDVGLHRAASSRSLTDSITDARALFSPEGTYLNTASYGLPPQAGWDALQQVLEEWRGGRTSWEGWSESTDGARAEFAKLVNTDPGRVAIGATVSGLVGLVAASLPAGSRVVIPEIEFTSTLFPFLVQPGLEVSTVPPGRLAEAIDEHTDAVAFSAVQMSTGEVADLDAILAAAEAPDRLDAIVPAQAGWYAGEDVHEAYIGPPLRLAHDARRLDTSPAWFSWVGALPALELLNRIGIEAIHEHDVALANRFRAGLGLEPSNSAIVSVEWPGALERLRAAGIQAAQPASRLRVGFHLYNTTEDVERVLNVLTAD
jgi:selenocysteine lyase/cysteine desulfurase